MHNGTDLAVVLEICDCEVVPAEVLPSLELLVERGQQFLEELLLFPVEFLLAGGLVAEGLGLHNHAGQATGAWPHARLEP